MRFVATLLKIYEQYHGGVKQYPEMSNYLPHFAEA